MKVYGKDGEEFYTMSLSVDSNKDEEFKKQACALFWSRQLSNLGIDNAYAPISRYSYDEHCGNSYTTKYAECKEGDFYLENLGFAIVKAKSFAEDRYGSEAMSLASKMETPVAILYPCGRFRVADYYSAKEGTPYTENDGMRYLRDDALLVQCSKCNEFYFAIKDGFTGCRKCGDANLKPALCIDGSKNILDQAGGNHGKSK